MKKRLGGTLSISYKYQTIMSLAGTIQQGETSWRSYPYSFAAMLDQSIDLWHPECTGSILMDKEFIRSLRHEDRYTKRMRRLNTEVRYSPYRINIRPTRQWSHDRRRPNCVDSGCFSSRGEDEDIKWFVRTVSICSRGIMARTNNFDEGEL